MTFDEAFADRYDEWSAHMTEDVPFYVELAREAEGPVVELAVGTGRVAIPVARAIGRPVIGIDSSPRMLEQARRDGGDLLQATGPGTVTEVSGSAIAVQYEEGGRRVYSLSKFRRSNQDTCINHRVRVLDHHDHRVPVHVENGGALHLGHRRRLFLVHLRLATQNLHPPAPCAARPSYAPQPPHPTSSTDSESPICDRTLPSADWDTP